MHTSSLLVAIGWNITNINHVIMFSCFCLDSLSAFWFKQNFNHCKVQTKIVKSNTFTRKRRKLKVGLILKKVAMRIQHLELKKWKIHKQPSLHRWYECGIRYTISFQFQVKNLRTRKTPFRSFVYVLFWRKICK
jgi:hypothetical protein